MVRDDGWLDDAAVVIRVVRRLRTAPRSPIALRTDTTGGTKMVARHAFRTIYGTLVVGSIALAGCGPSTPKSTTPFVTTVIRTKLPTAGSAKLCVLSFSSDGSISVQGGSVGSSVFRGLTADKAWQEGLCGKLTESHFNALTDQLNAQFKLVDGQDYEDTTTIISTDDKAVITDALTSRGAEFGLIVRDQFGWKWATGDSGIEAYWAEVECSIVNQAGEVVWCFASHGNITPPTSLAHLASAIVPITPSQDTITSDYAEFFASHWSVTASLIDEDATSQRHKCNVEDYVATGKYKTTVTIRNAKKAN